MVIKTIRPENWPWANRLSKGLLGERGGRKREAVRDMEGCSVN